MRKDEVELSYHREFSGRENRLPMVNVKVHTYPNDELIDDDMAEGFTFDWFESHVSDEQQDDLFWQACEDSWESLRYTAEDIFGPGLEVWSAGRSGGWCVVEGLPPVSEWDAIALSKWAKFCKWARLEADDVPYKILWSAAANLYEPWLEDQVESRIESDIYSAIGGG